MGNYFVRPRTLLECCLWPAGVLTIVCTVIALAGAPAAWAGTALFGIFWMIGNVAFAREMIAERRKNAKEDAKDVAAVADSTEEKKEESPPPVPTEVTSETESEGEKPAETQAETSEVQTETPKEMPEPVVCVFPEVQEDEAPKQAASEDDSNTGADGAKDEEVVVVDVVEDSASSLPTLCNENSCEGCNGGACSKKEETKSKSTNTPPVRKAKNQRPIPGWYSAVDKHPFAKTGK